jgi:hypothetical protein
LCLLAMHQSSGNSYFWLVNLWPVSFSYYFLTLLYIFLS